MTWLWHLACPWRPNPLRQRTGGHGCWNGGLSHVLWAAGHRSGLYSCWKLQWLFHTAPSCNWIWPWGIQFPDLFVARLRELVKLQALVKILIRSWLTSLGCRPMVRIQSQHKVSAEPGTSRWPSRYAQPTVLTYNFRVQHQVTRASSSGCNCSVARSCVCKFKLYIGIVHPANAISLRSGHTRKSAAGNKGKKNTASPDKECIRWS